MKYIYSLIAICAIAFGGAQVVLAEEGATTNASIKVDRPLPPLKAMIRTDVRAGASSTRMEIKSDREEFKAIASSTRREIEMNRQELRGDVKEKREDMKNASGTLRAEIKGQIETRRMNLATTTKVRVEGLLKVKIMNIGKEVEAVTKRLETVAGNIETYIARAKARGIDTSLSEQNLATARVKIADVRIAASAVSAVTVDQNDPQTSTEALKSAVEEVRSALKVAQEALTSTVRSIPTRTTATSTVSR